MRATDGEARESTPALTLVAGLSGVVLVLALVSCSGSATKAISPATLTSTSTTSAPPTTGAVTPTTVAPMTTTTVPTATLSTAGLVACNENELEAEYKGVQGARRYLATRLRLAVTCQARPSEQRRRRTTERDGFIHVHCTQRRHLDAPGQHRALRTARHPVNVLAQRLGRRGCRQRSLPIA